MKVGIEIPFLNADTEAKRRLVELVFAAHQKAAVENSNVSTALFLETFTVTGSFKSGVMAALLSIGDVHAPLQKARSVYLKATEEITKVQVNSGLKIPGYGNSFFKDDPAWSEVKQCVEQEFPDVMVRINQIKGWIGKDVEPNAAMWSAVVCELCSVPSNLEDSVFIMARVPAWGGMLC